MGISTQGLIKEVNFSIISSERGMNKTQEDVAQVLADIINRLIRIEDKQDQYESQINEIKKQIEGNGKPGIKQEIIDLRIDHTELVGVVDGLAIKLTTYAIVGSFLGSAMIQLVIWKLTH